MGPGCRGAAVEAKGELVGGRSRHRENEPFGLMVLAKIDQGRITSLSGKSKMCSLYMVGNPVIANRIIEIDLRGSFYVPFRVAVHDDGGQHGGMIEYDRPSSIPGGSKPT